MLSNIVNERKSWFTTIKELVENGENLEIHIPIETLTFKSLLDHSNDENEDSFYFKQLLNRIKPSSYGDIHSFVKLQALCYGELALIYNSRKAKYLQAFEAECDLSVNDLKYDQMNVIRIMRKDYEYSDQMIHM
jgi:hypothetical protein